MEFMDSWTLTHESVTHIREVWKTPVDSMESENHMDDLKRLVSTGDVAETSNPEELTYRHTALVIVIIIIGYLVVLCFGLVGNFSVLIVVVRTPRMVTVTNLFICNLAVADLLVLIFCILPNLVSNIFVPWVLGWFLCKTVPYIQGVSVCASIYSLVAISVERCLAIQWPFRTQLTKKTARFAIAGIWIWSFAVAAPWAIVFDLIPADKSQPDLDFCVEVWPSGYDWFGPYYFLFANLFLCYIFPLGLISMCYIVIWICVWRRPLPCDTQSSSIELIHQRAKAGVLKMLIAVVLMFAFSWLPLYLIFTRLKFGGELSPLESEIIDYGAPFAQWLGSSNSMWNPWIYAFLNVKFRRAFNSLFCGRKFVFRREPIPRVQKPNVSILLKRLNGYKSPLNTCSSAHMSSEV